MRWIRWIGSAFAIAMVILAFNYLSVASAARAVVNNDTRNDELDIWAYHRYGLLWREVVFDVIYIPGSASCSDVVRTFLQFAERMKDRSFSEVYLSHGGSVRFLLDGNAFQIMGREYAFQNPIYTLRTLHS